MRNRLLKQASREYKPRQRLALLAVAAGVFVVILPLALLRLGRLLDRMLDLPTVLHPPANAIIGGLMVLAGCSPSGQSTSNSLWAGARRCP